MLFQFYMAVKQQNELIVECENKPKLRTFITFKDYQQLTAYVGNINLLASLDWVYYTLIGWKQLIM